MKCRSLPFMTGEAAECLTQDGGSASVLSVSGRAWLTLLLSTIGVSVKNSGLKAFAMDLRIVSCIVWENQEQCRTRTVVHLMMKVGLMRFAQNAVQMMNK